VADGKLTQEKADERLAEIREHVTEIVNTPFSPPEQGRRPQRGPQDGPGLIMTAAEVIDITPEELIAELREGEDLSIADVAEAHDVDPNSIVDAVVEKASEHLADRVADGKLTQEEADERLAEIREHVTERINTPFSPPERGDCPERGPRGGAA
jgi:hypothetical protein